MLRQYIAHFQHEKHASCLDSEDFGEGNSSTLLQTDTVFISVENFTKCPLNDEQNHFMYGNTVPVFHEPEITMTPRGGLEWFGSYQLHHEGDPPYAVTGVLVKSN